MSSTITAVLTRIGETAAHYDRDRVVDAHAFDSLDLELGGTRIDLDHDPDHEVGQIVYAEISESDQLAIVGVIDDRLDLAAIEQPIYLSGEYEMRGDVRRRSYIAREAQLLSAGLTLSPAVLGAQPIRQHAGDLRNPSARSSWPFSWRSSDPLLARAIDYIGDPGWRTRSSFTATRIVDRRDKGDYPWPPGLRLRGLSPGDALPSGKLRKSGHAGRIISVR
jgi:hypothetical protein